jgi:hypothetical protein
VTGRVVICGAVAQKPFQAGHTWQFLQYLLGFRRLGWDVLLVDRLSGPVAHGDARVGYLSGVMRDAGLGDAWSIGLDGGEHLGLPRDAVLDRVAGADFLLNVMGFCTDEEILGAARRRVFLDTDPGFGQMWSALGLADVFAGHDAHVTIGERIGAPDCTIPTCGLRWITTPQPVVLDAWPVCSPPPSRMRFTSVASWRGAYGPIDYHGHRYGLRVHQFRRFAELPSLTAARFEVALDIHPAEVDDIELLRQSGWLLRDPATVARTPQAYRRYLQDSWAELMVAKGMYVDSRSGWFSERSICYLASGRPVLAQDTGLGDLYPLGDGLIAFSTVEEAVAGAEALRADPGRHAAAARELAEEHFDSDKVLGRLVEELA